MCYYPFYLFIKTAINFILYQLLAYTINILLHLSMHTPEGSFFLSFRLSEAGLLEWSPIDFACHTQLYFVSVCEAHFSAEHWSLSFAMSITSSCFSSVYKKILSFFDLNGASFSDSTLHVSHTGLTDTVS